MTAAFVVGLLVPLLLGCLTRRFRTAARKSVPAGPPAPPDADRPRRPPAERSGSGTDPAVRQEVLIKACIRTADLVRDHDRALWELMTESLRDAGIATVIPDGEPFDRTRHRAVERVPTSDPAQHLTVAATDSAGYRAGDRWIRHPQVQVYHHRPTMPAP